MRAWLTHLRHERGHAEKTLEAYERDLRQFLAYLQAHLGHTPCLADLGALQLKTVRAFLAARRRAGTVSRSLARTLSALRQFFRWLEAQALVKNRAVLQLATPKIPHSVPKPLTVEKAAGVMDAGPGAELDWVLARDAAVLLLLYGSGLRIAEALGIKAKDAPTGDRDVLRIKGKGGKERLVPVLPVVRSAVERYLALLPYPLGPGRAAVPRRQGRPAVAAHHPARDGAPARGARAAGDGDPARAPPLVRDAPLVGRRRPAPDPGIAGPRLAVDHPGLHRGRPRAAARRL